MKFIADSMLGRLTRWLRLSGYDVLYRNDITDTKIIEMAKSEKRVLLSRDKTLCRKAQRMDVKTSLILSSEIMQQLKQVIKEWGIEIYDTPVFSRCPMCNSKIEKAEKDKVKDKVPETVFFATNEFWRCNRCGKVYWHGGHWRNIKEMVERLNV
jgi:hypothetical protein